MYMLPCSDMQSHPWQNVGDGKVTKKYMFESSRWMRREDRSPLGYSSGRLSISQKIPLPEGCVVEKGWMKFLSVGLAARLDVLYDLISPESQSGIICLTDSNPAIRSKTSSQYRERT